MAQRALATARPSVAEQAGTSSMTHGADLTVAHALPHVAEVLRGGCGAPSTVSVLWRVTKLSAGPPGIQLSRHEIEGRNCKASAVGISCARRLQGTSLQAT